MPDLMFESLIFQQRDQDTCRPFIAHFKQYYRNMAKDNIKQALWLMVVIQ